MWLISARADFWVACAGGASLLVAMGSTLLLIGDRQLSATDLLLSELHLGATYGAIPRRRLWRRMPLEVLVVPLAILAGAYALAAHERSVLLATSILYLGAWHRGRQNLGIARPIEARGRAGVAWRRWIFSAAIYCRWRRRRLLHRPPRRITRVSSTWSALASPVLGALGALALGSLAHSLDRRRIDGRGRIAGRVVLRRSAGSCRQRRRPSAAPTWGGLERLVHAGAGLHHEVQYLYFTYATARRGRPAGPGLGGS